MSLLSISGSTGTVTGGLLRVGGGSLTITAAGAIIASPTAGQTFTLGKIIYASQNGLSVAIAAAGSSGHVIVSDTQSVTTALTVPSGVTLEIKNGGLLTFSGAGSLTFGVGSCFMAGRYQVFSGAPGTTVSLASAVDAAFPEWWGAKARSFYTQLASSPSSSTVVSADLISQLTAAGISTSTVVSQGWSLGLTDPANPGGINTGVGIITAINAGTSTFTVTGVTLQVVASGALVSIGIDDTAAFVAAEAQRCIIDCAEASYYLAGTTNITDASPNQPPPAVPILSTANTGGSYTGGTTYYVRGVNITSTGHSQAGPEAVIKIPAGTNTNTIVADFGGGWSSAIPANITRIDVYVDTVSGGGHFQASITTDGSTFPGTAAYNSSGAAPPTTNTATVPAALQGPMLRLHSNVWLRGKGPGRTILRCHAYSNGIYGYGSPSNPCSNIKISDVTVHIPHGIGDPLKIVNVTGAHIQNVETWGGDYGGQVMGCKASLVEYCEFHGQLTSGGAGLSVVEQDDGGGGYPLGTHSVRISNCRSHDNAGHGLRLGGQVNAAGIPLGVLVENSTFHDNTGQGIAGYEFDGAHLNNIAVWRNALGIYIRRCRRWAGASINAYLNKSYGIQTSGASDIAFSGGNIFNNGTAGGFAPGVYLNDDTDTAGQNRGSTGCIFRGFHLGNDSAIAQMADPSGTFPSSGPYPMTQTDPIYEQNGGLTGGNLIDGNFSANRGHTSSNSCTILGTSHGTNY